MRKKYTTTVTVKGKRPADATLEKLLELREHLTLAEIAQLWGISRQRVWALEKKAKERLTNPQ